MIKLLTLAFVAFFQVTQPADIKLIRSLYVKSVESYDNTLKLEKYLNSVKQTALVKGYKGAVTMMKAKHAGNPLQKLNYFKKGKAELEKAIGENPKEIELIYIRYGIQSTVPGFLNYNASLQSDKQFLMRNILGNNVKDKELKKNITDFLISRGKLTEVEKQEIKKAL